ncbi:MAG TPA: patatin-like protein [Burkholderiales bacterium]|nr:patatin-like protein [Burkholderiales bacterium]
MGNGLGSGAAPARVDSEEEIRFAVVMYGGVSLAIYINGVAQELLHMVRATAPKAVDNETALLGDAELEGAMRTYRRLGRHLLEWHDYRNRKAAMDIVERADALDMLSKRFRLDCDEAPIRSRFIVDVLSGTSAGGINSIYLAKALSNQQSLAGVKQLWISEGDIANLINDGASVSDLKGLQLQHPPQSLLNSQRMYRKLLDALDQMDPNNAAPTRSPLVEELDLFITTTDLEGLPLPFALGDTVVYERRHRNIFHFRYAGGKENDFIKSNDPFLAYAARCTSSFPFAFEPMCLGDIEKVTRHFGDGAHIYRKTPAAFPDWQKFYSEYWRTSVADFAAAQRGLQSAEGTLGERESDLKAAYLSRTFGDGGYLDNKPFSYATSMIMRRRADVPVRRKLLYIEPVPQHPESEVRTRSEKPNFAENVRTALELPSREMIREDIERVLERNRTLARISGYTREIDGDVASLASPHVEQDGAKPQPLTSMIEQFGVAYGAYHRLRVDETSGVLTDLIARAAQLDPRSNAMVAVRELVSAWRRINYAPNPVVEATMPRAEAHFLEEFDLQFRLRRLTFISRRINELALLDTKAEQLIAGWKCRGEQVRKLSEEFKTKMREDAWRASFRAELRELKKKLSDDRATLRTAQENLARIQNGYTPLTDAVMELGLSWNELEAILGNTPVGRERAANALVETKQAGFNRVAERIRSAFQVTLRFGDLLKAREADDAAAVARDCVAFYYANYHLYDMVIFPVQYGTGSAETSEIEIYRISPEDATQIIDERRDPRGRKKLAGTVLMNFGAFLEKRWRQNDMLWGRLDGAERLICAVMPAEGEGELAIRNALIRDAQEAILAEDLYIDDVENMSRTLASCLVQRLPKEAPEHSRQAALEEMLRREQKALPLAMQSALQACLKDRKALWEFYSKAYEVERKIDPEQAVRSMARSTRVTAQMLDSVARSYNLKKSPFAWLATFASMFWGLVEIAVPQTMWNLLGRHWITLLYLVDFGMIAGGMLVAQPAISKFGWMALTATFGIHALATVTGYYISGALQGRWFSLLKWILTLALAALLVGGALYYYEWLRLIRAEGIGVLFQ